MSPTIEASAAQRGSGSVDDIPQPSAPPNKSAAVSGAQLRAAAKVIDAYVNKTQTSAGPVTALQIDGQLGRSPPSEKAKHPAQ